MGELTGGFHFCAGCENDGIEHSRCTKGRQRQTDKELEAQGFKRVQERDGKERIVEIPHSLVETLFLERLVYYFVLS